LATTLLKHKHYGGLRNTTLSEFIFTHNCFELNDGENMPVTVIVDTEGFHITQQDYEGFEDHISLSWTQMTGLFEIVERIEGMYSNGRY
jgi:hypothetical protein